MKRSSGVSYGWQVCRFVPYVDAGVIARTPDESNAVRVGMVFERAENGFGVSSSLVFPRGKRAPSRESLRNANTAPKTPPSSCTAGYLRVPDARSVHRFRTFELANPPTESGSSKFHEFLSSYFSLFFFFHELSYIFAVLDSSLVLRFLRSVSLNDTSAIARSTNANDRTGPSEIRQLDIREPFPAANDELMPSVTRGSNDFNY